MTPPPVRDDEQIGSSAAFITALNRSFFPPYDARRVCVALRQRRFGALSAASMAVALLVTGVARAAGTDWMMIAWIGALLGLGVIVQTWLLASRNRKFLRRGDLRRLAICTLAWWSIWVVLLGLPLYFFSGVLSPAVVMLFGFFLSRADVDIFGGRSLSAIIPAESWIACVLWSTIVLLLFGAWTALVFAVMYCSSLAIMATRNLAWPMEVTLMAAARALTLVAPGGRRRWVRLVPTSSSSAWSQPPLPFFLSYVRHLTRCDWELARAVVTSSLQGGARISEARDASLLLMLEEIRRSLVGGAAVPPAQSMLPVSAVAQPPALRSLLGALAGGRNAGPSPSDINIREVEVDLAHSDVPVWARHEILELSDLLSRHFIRRTDEGTEACL